MKRYLFAIGFVLFLSIATSIVVKAGYATGPNNKLYMAANAGWNWVEGTLTNYHPTDHYYKQVYSQYGKEGSFSGWALPSTHSITHRDYRGLIDSDYSEVKPCWKLSASSNPVCAW